jgi:hypothetical protein
MRSMSSPASSRRPSTRAGALRSRVARRYSAATTLRATPNSHAEGAPRLARVAGGGVDGGEEDVGRQIGREVRIRHAPRDEPLDRLDMRPVHVRAARRRPARGLTISRHRRYVEQGR